MFKKKKMILEVEGMHCQNCKKKVIETLSKLEEVKKVKEDLEKKQVIIYPTKEIPGSDLANIIKGIGFELKKVDFYG